MRSVRRSTWSVLLLCVVVAAGLVAVLGASVALGQDESPAPADEKSIVRIGWQGDIDHLNPLIGWTNNVYEVYANNYLLMVARDWETSSRATRASSRAGSSPTTSSSGPSRSTRA
jgi:ABC-type nitrate/sulfonate/bicarbonate transport system substrate-binding protein